MEAIVRYNGQQRVVGFLFDGDAQRAVAVSHLIQPKAAFRGIRCRAGKTYLVDGVGQGSWLRVHAGYWLLLYEYHDGQWCWRCRSPDFMQALTAEPSDD